MTPPPSQSCNAWAHARHISVQNPHASESVCALTHGSDDPSSTANGGGRRGPPTCGHLTCCHHLSYLPHPLQVRLLHLFPRLPHTLLRRPHGPHRSRRRDAHHLCHPLPSLARDQAAPSLGQSVVPPRMHERRAGGGRGRQAGTQLALVRPSSEASVVPRRTHSRGGGRHSHLRSVDTGPPLFILRPRPSQVSAQWWTCWVIAIAASCIGVLGAIGSMYNIVEVSRRAEGGAASCIGVLGATDRLHVQHLGG